MYFLTPLIAQLSTFDDDMFINDIHIRLILVHSSRLQKDRSTHHLKTVKGRVQILHSFPYRSRIIRTYGLSPRHV